ncbi:hypothetical protein M3Y99_01667000 [Aphelenchoides fujianensis]|nr:hypothetical protein M3Y99_01667000 [Aphelenchoides fujianensis]
MIDEAFVRLLDGRREGPKSMWQGVLRFSSNAPVQALAPLALRTADVQQRVDAEAHDWRFLVYNRKFDEYCDVIGVERERRLITDGDKFEFAPRTATIFADVRPRSPLLFDNDSDDVKPSLEYLHQIVNARPPSASAASSESPENRFDRAGNSRQESQERPSRKRQLSLVDASFRSVEESANGQRNPEDGPCAQHENDPEACSHTFFRRVPTRATSSSSILRALADSGGMLELDQTIRCKLMNIIGHYLMLHADATGLPTAVERRIMVSTFLAQLPHPIDPKVFTNRAGTGCLDYWVRNRRKTTLREDGVFMVRGSKRRTVPKNADFMILD